MTRIRRRYATKTAILLGLVILWVTTAVSAAMTGSKLHRGGEHPRRKPLVKSIVSVHPRLSDSNEPIVPATREGNVQEDSRPHD